MSIKQQQAVWELCRQGYQVSADHAARCWSKGERFEVERELVIARSLERLIDQCNWEVEQEFGTGPSTSRSRTPRSVFGGLLGQSIRPGLDMNG